MSLYSAIESQLARNSGRPIIETLDRVFDGEALLKLVACVGGVLAGVGVNTDDRVVVQVEKSVEALALYLACLRIGAIFVPLNPAYSAPEVQYFLRDAEKRGVTVLLAGVRPNLAKILRNVRFNEWLPADRIYPEKDETYSATLNAVRHAYRLLNQESQRE